MQQGCHTHTINGLKSGDFDTKNFTFTVSANSQEEAIQKLSDAIVSMRSADVRVKESGVMLESVRVSYFYPNRPHCGMIGPYWDE
ncbi:hypothetical protein [Citrobacter braakii]|uniref:hypothetical protein n=1 Tax=Citrobacter braakii TaxID=57706 RepID=UPI004039D747